MPSAYTAPVADGQITELAPFALQLARGMGALIMMRDEPMSAPIPDKFEPAKYNAEKLAVALAERDRIAALTPQAAQAEADRVYAENARGRDDYIAEKTAQRDRYLVMIAKVEAWQGAPEGIKEFALEQLRQSIDFDCREPFEYYRQVVKQSGAEWRAEALATIDRDIAYHMKADSEERARTDERNAWLAQLRASLESAA